MEAFVAEHRGDWARLEALTRRRRLSGPETDELVALYQRTTAQLSVLRSSGYDPLLAALLSGQLARSRAAVTGVQVSFWQAVSRFATVSFPAAAYRTRRWWLGAAIVSMVATVLIGWEVARSPALQASLLTKQQIANLVRYQFRHYYSAFDGRSFAAMVWTHNALLAAETVLGGLLLGIPILYFLYGNAVNLGIVGALMISHGRAEEFWTLLLPHGMLELTVVFLAAGAGLRLGWTVIDPGPRPRGRALAQEGRAMVTIAMGLAGVLLVSGLIEAFVTPAPLPAWVRIGIGAVAEVAFIAYVLVLGRRAVESGQLGDMAQVPDEAPVAG